MDTVRKITAAIVGIIVIILIVLAAKWVGDRLRERFAPSTPSTDNIQEIPPEDVTLTPTPTATYSAIPATGPNDWLYIIVALMFIGSLSTLALAKRKV